MTPPETSGPQREPEGRPQDTVRHVIACTPCRDTVDGLQGKDDVLSYLAGPRRDPDLVENVLGKTALVGKKELGGMLYEMGRAALVLVPEVSERIDFIVRPEELGAIAKRAKVLSCRVPLDQVDDVLNQPWVGQPDSSDAARLVISFAELNLSVMGTTTNTLLLKANGAMALHEYGSALQTIENAITASTTRLQAIASRSLLAQTLIQNQEHEAALLRSQEFLSEYSTVPMLWYNYATSAAWLKRPGEFKLACKGLRTALLATKSDTAYWRQLFAKDATWFASQFGISRNDVDRELGTNYSEGAA